MGLLSGLAKSGVAKKLVDEARKPKNQQKIKDFVGNMRDRAGSGGGAAASGRGPSTGAADGTQTRATVTGQDGSTGTTSPGTSPDGPRA